VARGVNLIQRLCDNFLTLIESFSLLIATIAKETEDREFVKNLGVKPPVTKAPSLRATFFVPAGL
jgi:hypothetical protein